MPRLPWVLIAASIVIGIDLFQMPRRGWAALIASFAILSGCAAETSVDERPNDAPTFVSLNPCLDALLVELAEPEQVLALSHYSRDPSSSSLPPDVAARFDYTGGTAEEVIALAPDFVLASAFMPPATQAALEKAGLKVEAFSSVRSVSESTDQIGRISKLIGNPERGRLFSLSLMPEIAPDMAARIAQNPESNPSVLLWQPGQIVAGQDTLIAELSRLAGFTSHAAKLGLNQADHITLEQILSDPPDLLLVAGDSAGQRHPALDSLTNTQVHAFDPSLFYCGGPSIGRALDRLLTLRRSFEATEQ